MIIYQLSKFKKQWSVENISENTLRMLHCRKLRCNGFNFRTSNLYPLLWMPFTSVKYTKNDQFGMFNFPKLLRPFWIWFGSIVWEVAEIKGSLKVLVIFKLFLSHFSLNHPCISESYIEIKINFNFYFHTSLWYHKRFYEVL